MPKQKVWSMKTTGKTKIGKDTLFGPLASTKIIILQCFSDHFIAQKGILKAEEKNI